MWMLKFRVPARLPVHPANSTDPGPVLIVCDNLHSWVVAVF